MAILVSLGCNHEELANKKSKPKNGSPRKPDAKPIPSKEFSYEDLVWVAGGTFKMGGTTGQKDEQPVHTVKLNGFWIGKFEVTNQQYLIYLNNALSTGAVWEGECIDNIGNSCINGLYFSDYEMLEKTFFISPWST